MKCTGRKEDSYRKDVGFLTCIEETVFQAFLAMKNKRAVSGSAIDGWNGISAVVTLLGIERIEPCGPLESSLLTGKQLKFLSNS